jgi:prepilin-type processing-associated H-X9-DG protein
VNYWLNSWYFPSTGNKGLSMATVSRPAETVWIAETGNSKETPGAGYFQCYPSFYGGLLARNNATYGFDVRAASARLTDRHNEGLNVVWGDGHAKWMRREVLERDIHDDGLGSASTNPGSKYWWGR